MFIIYSPGAGLGLGVALIGKRHQEDQIVIAPFCSIHGLASGTLRLCTVTVRIGALGDGSCGGVRGEASSTTGELFSLL